MGYSLQGRKESDTTEQLTLTHTHTQWEICMCMPTVHGHFFSLLSFWFSLPDKIQVNGLYSGRSRNDYDFVGGKKQLSNSGLSV